jgi:hypothetical protein
MIYRVCDLEGAMLDAAVATAELRGKYGHWETDGVSVRAHFADHDDRVGPSFTLAPFNPSSDWSIGGPIIDREGIAFLPGPVPSADGRIWWRAMVVGGPRQEGSTQLIAAMRAYCAATFGDEVELP